MHFGNVSASWALLLACLLALVCVSCSEKQQAFSVEAKVTMRDGSSVEITDFALIGSRSFEPSGTYEVNQSKGDIDLPVHIFGYLWRELPISEIDSMVLEPIRENKYSWIMFRASIKTKAGEEMAGLIPADPDYTWHCARHFLVRGRSVVLGSEAAFEILFRELRRIETKDESTWILTDENGVTFDVRDPRFGMYWSAPLMRRKCRWDPREYGDILNVKVGDTETEIRLDAIERLRITEFHHPPSVHLATRDGREVSGVIDGYFFLFGRTKDSRTWFGPMLGAAEIEFAAPPRKRRLR